jgi:hypothetical protein
VWLYVEICILKVTKNTIDLISTEFQNDKSNQYKMSIEWQRFEMNGIIFSVDHFSKDAYKL